MNRLKYFFPALLVIFFSGCGLNDNVAPVPTYLIIKDPKVLKVNSTGEDTHKITDVWVYSDGQLQEYFLYLQKFLLFQPEKKVRF
ncbi:MAG: hypothetical protein IPG79_15740 [Saprospiraceae bacterium]|nr:hypothetical protein [Saprospiraceae bacterium]